MNTQLLHSLLLDKAEAFAMASTVTNCTRMCAGKADGHAGLVVDRFGPLVVATDYANAAPANDPAVATTLLGVLRACFPKHSVIVKTRTASAGGGAFVYQTFMAPDQERPLIGVERGLRFELGTDPTHDFGIYLDAAKARHHVRQIAKARRVLNLFSYTGAFGVAAAAGGATECTNVDPNRDYLAWSRRNAQLNEWDVRVLPDTAQVFLRKHLRRLERSPQTPGFDVVIVDPPAFGVGRGNDRVLRLLWPEIFTSLRTMQPAEIVLMCNDKAYRATTPFEDVVTAELGMDYDFVRLGTCWTPTDVLQPHPSLRWQATVEREDPHYLEPLVLAGRWKHGPGKRSRGP